MASGQQRAASGELLRSRGVFSAGSWQLAALFAAALLVSAVTAPVARADPRPDDPGKWRTAALFGGDMRSLAVHPDEPDTVLAGTSAGQVLVSRDGGASWADAGLPVPFRGWVVSSLHFDAARRGRLWAGLFGIWGGGMVAFSDDLGASWTPRSEGLPEVQVYSVATVRGEPGRIYAATRRGVWGSGDGGQSWRHLTADHPAIEKVTSLLVDPTHAMTVFAGTWRRVYRSDDFGRSWRGVFEGMVEDSEVFALEPVPGRPGEQWAATCGWVYHGVGWGARWSRHKFGGAEDRRTPSFAVLADGQLLAGTVGGLYASRDGGRSWLRRTPEELTVTAIAHHRARPGRVLLGTEGAGVWISEDGAASFAAANSGIANLRIAALAEAGGRVFAAVRDAGPMAGVYRSTDGGLTFPGAPIELPPVLALAADAGVVWAATEAGLWEGSGAAWRRVAALGERRVDQVVARDARVVALAGGELWERRGPSFSRVAYGHGAARSAALAGGALWVSDGDALYRLSSGTNRGEPAPGSGRLAALADRLVLAGSGGAWLRTGLEGAWARLASEASRVFPTGDPGRPFLLAIGGREAGLYAAERGALEPLDLPVPARDVTAALVAGGRLLVGTSGYGVLVRDLEPSGVVRAP